MSYYNRHSNIHTNVSSYDWSYFETVPNSYFYHQSELPATTVLSQLSDSNFDVVPTVASSEEIETEYRLPNWGICVIIVGYSFVFIFGVIGNCSVLIVVARLQRMKTVTNYFICNLAIADLLVLLFCLLPNLLSNIFIPWILGWFLCKTVPYIQGISVCASVYSLVAISVERCIAIQWPFKYQITKSRAKKIIFGIWTWSCIVALPWGLFFDTYQLDHDHPDDDFCIEKWPDEYISWSKYYFLVGNFIICYMLPLGIIFVCYMTIWCRVQRRPVPNDSNHKNMEMMHQKAKMAVLKMLLVVVLIFTLSWMPLYCITLREKFGPQPLSDWEEDVISFIIPIAQWLGSFNSGINPVVYSFLNKKFRHGFHMIFKWSWNQDSMLRPSHKSPTVNILLRRMTVYRVRTSTMYQETDEV